MTLDLDWVAAAAGASHARRGAKLQTLWSGYGEIVRVELEGGAAASVVVKHVRPPAGRGDLSHRRKLRSYEVERTFYTRFAERCDASCRVPRLLADKHEAGGWLFVLEDLDAAGFAGRGHRLSEPQLDACLRWIASFHATFLGTAPDGLWREGTYWHLATRPDELDAMPSGPLKDAAGALDRALARCTHRTLVHGDAKVANFCFALGQGARVAALDFQYVGGGCGMKDVAYLLSCMGSRACERHADRWLDAYFVALRRELATRRPEVDAAALEAEWRRLWPVAWADFARFLAGWAPGELRGDSFTQKLVERALGDLRGRSGV